MVDLDPTTAAIGAEILPFEVGYLPEFYQKKGEIELNYTESVRKKTLRGINEAMSKGDTLKDVRISNELLLMFLTSRKYDVGRAFSQLNKFVHFKRKNDIMFKVPSFEVLSVFMTSELVTVLPWRCQDGCTLILIQLGKCNSKQHPVEAIKQFYTLFLSQCLRDPMTQVNGFKVIIDLNITLEVLKICTPQNMYTFYYGTMVILPGRFKGIHIINMGVTGRAVWQMTSVFLSTKIKERVHFHQTIDGLLDYFPKSILPVKYGGNLKDYDMTEWLKRVSSPEEISFLEFRFLN